MQNICNRGFHPKAIYQVAIIVCVGLFISGSRSTRLAARSTRVQQRVKTMYQQSPEVFIAKLKETGGNPQDTAESTLTFSILKNLKRTRETETIQLGSLLRGRGSRSHTELTSGVPVLMFTKLGENGIHELDSSYSYFPIPRSSDQADLKRLIIYLSYYDQERLTKKKMEAWKQLILETLSKQGRSWLKENAAEDLFDLVREYGLAISESESDEIFTSIMASKTHKVTEPLCLILKLTGYENLPGAFLHSLFETDTGSNGLRLAPLILDNDVVLNALLRSTEEANSSNRYWFTLNLLRNLSAEKKMATYHRLWDSTKKAREAIKSIENFGGSSDEFFSHYLGIRSMSNRKEQSIAFKDFYLNAMSRDDSNLKVHLSEKLQVLVMFNRESWRLDQDELKRIHQAVLGTKSYRVAMSLCLILDFYQWSDLIQACSHALTETALLETSDTRLSPIIGKHEALSDLLIKQAMGSSSYRKINRVLLQTVEIPDEVILPKLNILWKGNPLARNPIETNLNYANSKARKSFLSNLKNESEHFQQKPPNQHAETIEVR